MPEEEQEKKPQKPEEAAATEGAPERKEMPKMVKRLILAGIIFAILAIEAVVALFLVRATKQEDPRVLAAKQEKQDEVRARMRATTMGMTTDPIEMIVNIAGSDNEERYAKVAVQLEFDDIKYPSLLEQLKLREPKIKNILIEALTAMKLEDIVSTEGKIKLRQTIRRDVNKTLPKDLGTVRDVFLSEFVIQ